MYLKKKDVNRLSQAELEEYVEGLPETAPPKWSSAGLLTALGVIGIWLFCKNVKTEPISNTWYLLALGILALGGAGYVVYKILHFNSQDPWE